MDLLQRHGPLALENHARPRGVEPGARSGAALAHGIQEDAVGIDRPHHVDQGVDVRLSLAPRADVPRVVIDVDSHAMAVELPRHVAHAAIRPAGRGKNRTGCARRRRSAGRRARAPRCHSRRTPSGRAPTARLPYSVPTSGRRTSHRTSSGNSTSSLPPTRQTRDAGRGRRCTSNAPWFRSAIVPARCGTPAIATPRRARE